MNDLIEFIMAEFWPLPHLDLTSSALHGRMVPVSPVCNMIYCLKESVIAIAMFIAPIQLQFALFDAEIQLPDHAS